MGHEGTSGRLRVILRAMTKKALLPMREEKKWETTKFKKWEGECWKECVWLLRHSNEGWGAKWGEGQ